MAWLSENWFWLLVAALFFWMHTRMHGGHGGHGGHAGGCGQGHRPGAPPEGDSREASHDQH